MFFKFCFEKDSTFYRFCLIFLHKVIASSITLYVVFSFLSREKLLKDNKFLSLAIINHVIYNICTLSYLKLIFNIKYLSIY